MKKLLLVFFYMKCIIFKSHF